MPITIIIPAYQPTNTLSNLIKKIHQHRPLQDIIVVNDGSTNPESIDMLRHLNNITIIEHAVNLGKGAALKSGFNYYLIHHNHSVGGGVVTADADGQHCAEDIIRMCDTLENDDASLHLGVRQFSIDTPLRSRIGNMLTCFLFAKIFKCAVTDTQTGLRGIPKSFLQSLLMMKGRGYEFEMEMLLSANEKKWPIREMAIQTIYTPHNHTSHFRPIKDSYRIYRTLALNFLKK